MTRVALKLNASSSPDVFKAMLLAAKLPAPYQEYRFAYPRRWRFDYAWPTQMVALETEGGVWTRGRHTRGIGFLRDAEKYNAAALMGWKVFRVTPQQLCAESTIQLLKSAINGPTIIQEEP